MPRKKPLASESDLRPIRPAVSPEAQESLMISLATDLAMKQLQEGTASSQVITHYLKLGTAKERLEREILEKQKDLMDAKTEAIKSAKRMEELYAGALDAMRRYSGYQEEADNAID